MRGIGSSAIAAVCTILLTLMGTCPAPAQNTPDNGRSPGSNNGKSTTQGLLPLDTPLLPACPGGLSPPLPPGKIQPPLQTDSRKNTPRNAALAEGKGKYSGMLLVPAGSFDMGSGSGDGRPDEKPGRRVFVKAFHIGRNPVTVSEYCEFLNQRGLKSGDGQPRINLESPDCPIASDGRGFTPRRGYADLPVVCVSWHGAAEYSQWAGGRLPTEAEWEKAALFGGAFNNGTENGSEQNGRPSDTNGRKSPQKEGALQMVGQVWEWCSDWYAGDYYSESPAENPTGPATGVEKDVRGWSLVAADGSRRIQNRHKAFPKGYYRTIGFRLVKD